MQRRRLLLAMLACGAGASGAQDEPPPTLELNRASRAELESLPGIGPQLAERLLRARAERLFADWADVLRRVGGIRAASARKLSAQGLRVNGQPYSG